MSSQENQEFKAIKILTYILVALTIIGGLIVLNTDWTTDIVLAVTRLGFMLSLGISGLTLAIVSLAVRKKN